MTSFLISLPCERGADEADERGLLDRGRGDGGLLRRLGPLEADREFDDREFDGDVRVREEFAMVAFDVNM